MLTEPHIQDQKIVLEQIFNIFLVFFIKAHSIKLFSFTFKTLLDSSVFKISFSLNRSLDNNHLSSIPEGVFRNLRVLKYL